MAKKQSRNPSFFRKIFRYLRRECKTLRWQSLLVVIVAGFINALGVALFLYPMKLYDSGISGLSMLLDQVTPPEFTLSLFLILINFPIFAFGAKKQGFAFTVYSFLAVKTGDGSPSYILQDREPSPLFARYMNTPRSSNISSMSSLSSAVSSEMRFCCISTSTASTAFSRLRSVRR